MIENKDSGLVITEAHLLLWHSRIELDLSSQILVLKKDCMGVWVDSCKSNNTREWNNSCKLGQSFMPLFKQQTLTKGMFCTRHYSKNYKRKRYISFALFPVSYSLVEKISLVHLTAPHWNYLSYWQVVNEDLAKLGGGQKYFGMGRMPRGCWVNKSIFIVKRLLDKSVWEMLSSDLKISHPLGFILDI